MRIKPMPPALQSVFRNVGASTSYRAKTGDDVMQTLISSNHLIKAGNQSMMGIGLRKYALSSWHIGFIHISR